MIVNVPRWRGQLDEYTKMLLHFDGVNEGTVFKDEAGHAIGTFGSPVTSTSQKKFGSAAGFFNGSSYISSSGSDIAAGTGDFTVDCWVRPAQKSTWIIMDTHTSEAAGGFFLATFNNGFSCKVANIDYGRYDFTINQWYHLALSRNGGTTRFFVNGSLKETRVNSADLSGSNIRIGGRTPGGTQYYFNGYIDEFRLSIGIARWASSFTPPSAPY